MSLRKSSVRLPALLVFLAVATLAFTRGSMADASLPTQTSIDEARTLLSEAQRRLLKVGDDVWLRAAGGGAARLTG